MDELKLRFPLGGEIALKMEIPDLPSPTPTIDFMPIMTGITDYFDCRYGLNDAAWENQMGGEDIRFTGVFLPEDGSVGVYGTDQSYGSFHSAYSESRTIYAVFRTDFVGNRNLNVHIIGSAGGDVNVYKKGAWFTIGVEGYNTSSTISSDQWGVGIGSDVVSTEYHVVALTRDNGGTNKLYIDGAFVGSLLNSEPYSDTFGIGLVMDSQGQMSVSPNVLQQIKMLSVGKEVHSEEQISENTAFLQKYLLGITSEQKPDLPSYLQYVDAVRIPDSAFTTANAAVAYFSLYTNTAISDDAKIVLDVEFLGFPEGVTNAALLSFSGETTSYNKRLMVYPESDETYSVRLLVNGSYETTTGRKDGVKLGKRFRITVGALPPEAEGKAVRSYAHFKAVDDDEEFTLISYGTFYGEPMLINTWKNPSSVYRSAVSKLYSVEVYDTTGELSARWWPVMYTTDTDYGKAALYAQLQDGSDSVLTADFPGSGTQIDFEPVL